MVQEKLLENGEGGNWYPEKGWKAKVGLAKTKMTVNNASTFQGNGELKENVKFGNIINEALLAMIPG